MSDFMPNSSLSWLLHEPGSRSLEFSLYGADFLLVILDFALSACSIEVVSPNFWDCVDLDFVWKMQEELRKLKEANRKLQKQISQYCMEDLSLHEIVLLQQDMETVATKTNEHKYKLIANETETTKKKVRNREGIHRNLVHAYINCFDAYTTMKWARMQVNTTDNSDRLHEPYIQSHLNLALLDVEDDSVSFNSIEQNVSLEDYLRGRWSRSSSFD